MSDETGADAPTQEPAVDTGAGEDDSVTLSRAQVDQLFVNAKNAAAAEMRRAGAFKKQAPQDDPRVKRGLQLLEQYESEHARAQEDDVRFQARWDAVGGKFQERTLEALQRTKSKAGSPTTQQPAAQPQSDLAQLVELMKLDIQSRLAEKMPKAPVSYATQGDQLRGEINAEVASIPEDDPRRLDKIQASVLKRLSGVKVTPTGKK